MDHESDDVRDRDKRYMDECAEEWMAVPCIYRHLLVSPFREPKGWCDFGSRCIMMGEFLFLTSGTKEAQECRNLILEKG